MSLFSDRHGPARTPPEVGDIPLGVRQAILDWFHKGGVSSAPLWDRFKELHGYGNYEQVAQDIGERYGGSSFLEFTDGVEEGRQRGAATADPTHWIARGALSGVPAGMFLDVLTEAIRKYEVQGAVNEYYDNGAEAISYINDLFERRAVAYRAGEDGQFEWFGDSGAADIVIQPALTALADARLAGASGDFSTALSHLRKGAKKDLEQAVHEAAKAVESAMKSLLDARSVPRNEKDTAQTLWDHLRNAGIAPKQTEAMILASSRIRNAFGGHGAGPQPHDVPPSLAVAAVGSSATAIVYLAQQLP